MGQHEPVKVLWEVLLLMWLCVMRSETVIHNDYRLMSHSSALILEQLCIVVLVFILLSYSSV